jgi:hypothetical protein
MSWNSPANTSGLRLRLASANVERRGTPAAEVIQPRLMALHRGFNLAQRAGSGQLAVQKPDQLMPGVELAHQFIAAVLLHKPIERGPRNQFEQIAKNAILCRTVLILFVSRRLETF